MLRITVDSSPNFAKWAGPLHALIVPASFKQKIRRGEMKKSDLPEFQWTPACQEGFDQLKKALTEAPILAYPDYSKPFILETDASLKGLGAVLSQKGDDNEIRVVAYASRSLRPSEKSMRDYSSAKIELMALKWSVCDNVKDYLLGSKFTVFTDNNPLCYIKSSKLGAAQIRWLSELALYDFDIVYRTGKSNQVADALSRRPEVEEEIEREVLPESDDEEWIAVSYQVEEQGGRISSMEFNQVISELVGGTNIDKKLKDRIQVTDVTKEKLNGNTIEVATGMVSLSDSIPPKEMAEFQRQDNQIAPIFTYVKQDQKPSKKATYQIRSKLARKLALQWDRLILKQGVLHRLYIFNEIEYHQLVLPQRYHRKVLTALHDHMGHQGIDRTLDLLRERVYWPSMAKDAQDWVTGASSVQSDDPSKDDDGNNRDNQSLRPKRNQEYGKNSSEAKSDKDSGKSKNTQTGSGKHRNKKLNTLGGYAGQVMVGDRKQPICIPAGTSKVVIGKTQEKLPRGSYMVEATDDDNLPCGVSVNHTYVNPTKPNKFRLSY